MVNARQTSSWALSINFALHTSSEVDKAGADMASKIQWNLKDTSLAVADHKTLGQFLPADVEAYACWETVGKFLKSLCCRSRSSASVPDSDHARIV